MWAHQLDPRIGRVPAHLLENALPALYITRCALYRSRKRNITVKQMTPWVLVQPVSPSDSPVLGWC